MCSRAQREIPEPFPFVNTQEAELAPVEALLLLPGTFQRQRANEWERRLMTLKGLSCSFVLDFKATNYKPPFAFEPMEKTRKKETNQEVSSSHTGTPSNENPIKTHACMAPFCWYVPRSYLQN